MNREQMLAKLTENMLWDFVIVGGGSVGLGIAVEAASRGYQTLLLEKKDFSQETSSKSTKLIHGGVRYLRQRHFSLVSESLKERAFLLKNAPHLVKPLSFILPTRGCLSSVYYYLGIKLYDFLSGPFLLKKSLKLSQTDLKRYFPFLKEEVIDGGIEYFDGQFDDTRMAINLAQTSAESGGTLINYMRVTDFIKLGNKMVGVKATDTESGFEYSIQAKAIINATGAFVDNLRSKDDPLSKKLVLGSQGAHLVLPKEFFPSSSAMILPETVDGRVLFIIPWKGCVLIGTTETLLKEPIEEPNPFQSEVDFILDHAAPFLAKKAQKSDVLSAFAGIRPLANLDKDKPSSKVSRDYSITISPSGLISVVGGKWTTYRKMGEDIVNLVAENVQLPHTNTLSQNLPIHGSPSSLPEFEDEWSFYGTDKELVEQIAEENKNLLQKFHPKIPCRPVDVIWGVRMEMARKVEDILARRTRCLFLGAQASIDISPQVASVMAKELGLGKDWEAEQIKTFRLLASNYLV